MSAYATTAQLATWLGVAPPGDAARLLDRASELLDSVVVAPFEIDDVTQLPTDADVAAALRDAACAVVETWIEVGEEVDIDGLAGTTIRIADFEGKRAGKRYPRAYRILQTARLMTWPWGVV